MQFRWSFTFKKTSNQGPSWSRRNDKTFQSSGHPCTQLASTCSSKQRSSSMASHPVRSARFTAVAHGGSAGSSESVNAGNNKPCFPFLRLPAELREAIYLFVIQPITPLDTAAIPGTPDRVHIPPVAQASRLVRREALAVLFRSRPVEISLHSSENLRRARLWTEICFGQNRSFGAIIFSGCLKHIENQFYHITLLCSDYTPYFVLSAKPGASSEADILIAQIKAKLLLLLDQKVQAARKGQEGRISRNSIAEMIELINKASSTPLQAEQSMVTLPTQ